MSRLAVIFPGIGYTADRPLLHFSRRIAAASGYEILIMDYKGFPSKVKGDRKRMEESFGIALTQAEEMLSGVDLTEYPLRGRMIPGWEEKRAASSRSARSGASPVPGSRTATIPWRAGMFFQT